jgi:hypothetical protein
VNFDFMDRRSAERFAELLDETTGGRRRHTPDGADEEIAELVAIGNRLSASRSSVQAQVDTEFRTGLRAMLMATAERDGIGATAAETEPVGGHAAVREPRRGFLRNSGARRIRARGAIVIGVAAGAMAVSGISAASENASPGDALYGVKRSAEKAHLAIAGSDVTRGQLWLDFARNRLAEAAALPGDDDAVSGVLADMDADTTEGVKLLTGSAVSRKQTAPLRRVDGFVAGQRQILEPMLGHLSPENRARAATSMALLENAHRRADSLRGGLACGTITPAGSDILGPKLKGCLTGTTDGSAQSNEPARRGEAGSKSHSSGVGDAPRKPATDDRADPAGTGTGKATQPNDDSDDSRTKPGVSPTTTTQPPATVPLLPEEPAVTNGEDDGGLLGGLVNIF